jgi:anti-anti-sigma regulatory factor
MDIRIDIDLRSTEATAARRQMLSLISAYTGGESTYLPMLAELANALVTTSDPVVLALRIANFMDSAALISFALANSLAQLEQRDVGHVLKVVEDAVEKRLSKAGFTQ